ncbi:hypothetical protein ACA910_016481 [Epithemia clementina (nom. ined.)]
MDDDEYDPFFDTVDTGSCILTPEAVFDSGEAGELLQALPQAAINNLPPKFRLPASLSQGVKQQGNVGSCSAFATTAAIEAALRQRQHTANPQSDAFLYYNAKVRIARHGATYKGGISIRDAVLASTKHGICDSRIWPYNDSTIAKIPPTPVYQSAEKRRVMKAVHVGPLPSDLKACLVRMKCPVIAAFACYKNHVTKGVRRTGDIPEKGDGETGTHHAICIFGYDDYQRRFRFKNSWGEGWGNRGWGTLPYDLVSKYDRWAILEIAAGPSPSPAPSPQPHRVVAVTTQFYIVSTHGTYLTMCCRTACDNSPSFNTVHLHNYKCKHSVWEWYQDSKFIRNVATGRYLRGGHTGRTVVDSYTEPLDWERWFTRSTRHHVGNLAYYIINATNWSLGHPAYLHGDPLTNGNFGETLLTTNTFCREKWNFVPAEIIMEGHYHLRNPNSGLVLDIKEGRSKNGTPLQIMNAHDHPAHLWTFEEAGTDTMGQTLYYIVNPMSGKVVDVQSGHGNGRNALLWQKDGTTSQKWKWNQKEFINAQSGQALDVNECGTTRGTKVQVWQRNGTVAQQWELVRIG